MKDYEQILARLNEEMPEAPRVARHNADKWKDFVEKFPVGAFVKDSDDSINVRTTQDGRYYDDASDKWILVSNGGVWTVSSILPA